MIHLSEQSIADTAHFFIGMSCVTLPVALNLHGGQAYGSLFVFLFSLAKEFWFDLQFEDEATSGGIWGGVQDFSGYITGMVIANLVLAYL